MSSPKVHSVEPQANSSAVPPGVLWESTDLFGRTDHAKGSERVNLSVQVEGNQTLLLTKLMTLVGRFDLELQPHHNGEQTDFATGNLLLAIPATLLGQFESALYEAFEVRPGASNSALLVLSEKMPTPFRLTIFAEQDDPRLLAELFLHLATSGVNVENVRYSTASTMDGRWGRADVRLTVAQNVAVEELWELLCSDAIQHDWQLRLESRGELCKNLGRK